MAQATAAVAIKKKQKRNARNMVCDLAARQGRRDGWQFCITLNWRMKLKHSENMSMQSSWNHVNEKQTPLNPNFI